MTTAERARILKWPYAIYCVLVLTLAGCATTQPRSSLAEALASPADIACSLPDPTGVLTLVSCGAALAIRSIGSMVNTPTAQNVEPVATTTTVDAK